MSEALLTLLRWCLLALIYLFFFRVLQATWFSTAAGRRSESGRNGAARSGTTGGPARGRGQSSGTARGTSDDGRFRRRRRGGDVNQRSGSPPTLVIVEPAAVADQRFEVITTLSIGRAAGCEITLDDTFVSQLHARVTRSPNGVVIEDMGSTNGTYLNRKRVTAPVVMQTGDVAQVGSTVLELQ